MREERPPHKKSCSKPLIYKIQILWLHSGLLQQIRSLSSLELLAYSCTKCLKWQRNSEKHKNTETAVVVWTYNGLYISSFSRKCWRTREGVECCPEINPFLWLTACLEPRRTRRKLCYQWLRGGENNLECLAEPAAALWVITVHIFGQLALHISLFPAANLREFRHGRRLIKLRGNYKTQIVLINIWGHLHLQPQRSTICCEHHLPHSS